MKFTTICWRICLFNLFHPHRTSKSKSSQVSREKVVLGTVFENELPISNCQYFANQLGQRCFCYTLELGRKTPSSFMIEFSHNLSFEEGFKWPFSRAVVQGSWKWFQAFHFHPNTSKHNPFPARRRDLCFCSIYLESLQDEPPLVMNGDISPYKWRYFTLFFWIRGPLCTNLFR